MQDTFILYVSKNWEREDFIRRKNRESVIFWFLFVNGISLVYYFKKKLLKTANRPKGRDAKPEG